MSAKVWLAACLLSCSVRLMCNVSYRSELAVHTNALHITSELHCCIQSTATSALYAAIVWLDAYDGGKKSA